MVKSSKSSFIIAYPRNFSFLFLILSISVLSFDIFLKTFLLLTRIRVEIVQLSLPYKKVDITYQSSALLFVSNDFSFLQNLA